MGEIALGVFVCIGIVVIYIFALIVATMISVEILRAEGADGIDYAMTANAIQFFVIVMVIVEKVAQWMA